MIWIKVMYIKKVKRQLDKNIKINKSGKSGEYYGRYYKSR